MCTLAAKAIFVLLGTARSVDIADKGSSQHLTSLHVEDFPIDVVYCWGGESMQHDDADGMKVAANTSHHGHGLYEMNVSLRSLRLYAPWLNKIYLLVNGPAQVPTWAANDPRIVMVDRCTLFPNRTQCPTYNTFACQSVVHLVPGLNEHFVYMDDDFFFVKPLEPSNFFSADGRPLSDDTKGAGNEIWGPRDQLSGPDMPPEHLPHTGMGHLHSPTPMLVSFARSLEDEFGDWFAFERSHKTRFVCCDASIEGNNYGRGNFFRVYTTMLYEYKKGKQQPECRGTYCECFETASCVQECLQQPDVMILNFNAQNVVEWRTTRRLMGQHMDAFNASRNRPAHGPSLRGSQTQALP